MSYDDIHKSVPTDQDDVAIAPTLTPGEPGQHEQDGSLTAAEAKLTHKAKWSDLFTVLASGCALISDGYQNNLMTMLNATFAKRYPDFYTSHVSTRVSNSLLVGAIIGQITVGVICDRVGRKPAVVTATGLLVLGAIFATASSAIGGSVSALFWWFTIARGAVGVGVGGEYPTSSASCSEAAHEKYGQKKRSSVFILCTNVVLSLGGPLAVSCFLIVLSASQYGNTLTPTSALDLKRLDITWRVCTGIGAALPLSVFYFRIKMLNSKLYRQSAIKHNVPYWLFVKRYWRRLIGTCGAWFLYDIVTFPNSAFSATIISSVLKTNTLLRTGEYQLLLGALAMPGAILGAFTISKLGTKWQMVLGFSGYLVIGLIIGLAWDKVTQIPVLFVILYAIFTSLGNFGPGSTCGLAAADSYPSSLRGTAYGLSAAIGKTGAAVGTEIFRPIQDSLGKRFTFIIAAGIGVLGVLVAAFFVVDTTKLDLTQEDKDWEAYLALHGWHGELGSNETVMGVGKVEAQHSLNGSKEGGVERESSDFKGSMT